FCHAHINAFIYSAETHRMRLMRVCRAVGFAPFGTKLALHMPLLGVIVGMVRDDDVNGDQKYQSYPIELKVG
ncbi:hypothetical protein EV183_000054, partial [Coemansia sp. RSA 2336]